MKTRIVMHETLDGLAENHPDAMRSRRDLQRIHRAMGTRGILQRALKRMTASRRAIGPLRVLELGAGDGSLMLEVARVLAPSGFRADLSLLDRQAVVARDTITSYAGVNWLAAAHVVDVHAWAKAPVDPLVKGQKAGRWDLIITNLFLHHFEGQELATLLGAVAQRTDGFIACEPRRAWLPLLASYMVGAIGANAVTREDAVLSVQAGFMGNEISYLWPDEGAEWRIDECSSGLFSHCFQAQRVGVT